MQDERNMQLLQAQLRLMARRKKWMLGLDIR
jgi:hypothetical protein